MSTASHPQTTRPPGTGVAVTGAVKAAARFDRKLVSFNAGLLAAVPVVAVLTVGIAIGKPVWGVTMGAGAMLVGIAWRVTGGRPPLALMATDAVAMALSTFVGCVTGSVTWVHIAVLCLWSLMAGLLVSVGNRGGVVGNQSIIALVVFGRFNAPVDQALGLATLVLTGGLAQVAFLSIVRWPLPLRNQRAATGAAYQALSALAAASDEASTLPAAEAIDKAEASLASPTMFGDAAVMTLRSLVNEAFRLRVQLMAIHTLLRQLRAAGSPEATAPDSPVRRALALAAVALDTAALAIGGDEDAGERLQRRGAELGEEVQAYEGGDPVSPALHMERRLGALAGQMRAVASLAPAAGRSGGLLSSRPYGRTNRPLQRLRADLEQLRANMSLASPAGRHALRLAVVVPVAALIARELPLQRSYWMVVAAATVLRPEFGATFTRGAERALGTCLGVALAGAIAVILHPAGGVTIVIVGILAWVGYSVFPASFAAGFAFITALVVFLINVISPDTLATATARLLDTLVGGFIGLVAYALWPTWAHTSAWQSLGDLVGAERTYLDVVLAAAEEGRRPGDSRMRSLARRARLARTTAESTVARSLSEPRRIDASQSQRALAAMRRLVQAAHVLRLDTQDERERRPLPALQPLRTGIGQVLSDVEASLRARPQEVPAPHELPDIRARYRAFQRESGDDEEAVALGAQLDEIVDAANSLAAAAGLESADDTEQHR
ncbi:MAG: FUSC family protein [Solirubrobacteraceae bacterium]